ncbi:MAG: ferritin-like domain-containing protein, partial [Dehalococcoidia bacterium]|nr:ferritin-like domain-containing protein [Dehalococcoidia bacterium]
MSEEDTTARALELMAQTLVVEYRFIMHYPRLANMVPEGECRDIVKVLGEDSVRHADIVMEAIRSLGGTPPFPSMEPLPDLPVVSIFRKQLEYEKLALFLHTEAAEMVGPGSHDALKRIAEQERW